MIPRLLLAAIGAAVAAALATAAPAQPRISLSDTFPIGSTGNAVCTAQALLVDPALASMFDRGYAITCRDAAAAVGRLYSLSLREGDPSGRLAERRSERVRCAPGEGLVLGAAGAVSVLDCSLSASGLAYRVYLARGQGRLFVAEGLAGYDSALRLGLESIAADRPVDGEVSVATTGAGDAASFARIQAGSSGGAAALAEAYRRNNAGNYVEAAAFFAAVGAADPDARAEALVNEALQQSNLGNHGQAEAMFADAAASIRGDPVLSRQLRNNRSMHLLNQGLTAEALAELAAPMRDAVDEARDSIRALEIDAQTAEALSGETRAARNLGRSEVLTPRERAEILDAQALQLRGSALRLEGRTADAASALREAERRLAAVRGGRVGGTIWMRAQIQSDLADLAEDAGNAAEAEQLHLAGIRLLEINYPASAALLSARGRRAHFLARTERPDEARALFREIVDESIAGETASPALRRSLATYFELLTGADAPADAAADLFRASQLLVRPGVAQTQAVLARELSGGSDEAARLFRQSVNLARDVERLAVESGRLEAQEARADMVRVQTLRADLARLREEQAATQSALAAFPRYRAVSNAVVDLRELQQILRPGEAYYKMVVAGDHAFGVLVTPTHARVFRLAARPEDVQTEVDALRETIAVTRNGRVETFPFDVERAHRLYLTLFGPVAAEIASAGHLIFEPDGAMLRLPPNLLVMDGDSVAVYQATLADPETDGFDFRGVKWLGRDRDVTTAMAVRAFRDVRLSPPSAARSEYLGLGSNEPVGTAVPASIRSVSGRSDRCEWPLDAWNRPIAADELQSARQAATRGLIGRGDVVTGARFTDVALGRRDDLDQYRILHFATHGLLVPPRPDCPARPALMTSFGGEQSDGLLTFSEIFDLDLDADLVILSACDTAGQASLVATREAGITTGGEQAFDGLVRAFVGAGGRLVIASHWPVPDEYRATQRLIGGMFAAPPGVGAASALRAAQRALMDDPDTSHPFYWAAFAVVGDGTVPILRAAGAEVAVRARDETTSLIP